MTQLIAGCDCGKDSLYVCVLDSDDRPPDLKTFARRYKPITIKNDKEGIQKLLKLADVFAIEPTGSYSYIWIDSLKSAGKDVRIVSSMRVRNFCRYQGLTNKCDRDDAAAIATYTLDNLGNPEAFLSLAQMRLRELYLALRSASTLKNPVANRLGQRLVYECPEMVQTVEQCQRNWLGHPPAVLRTIAGLETDDRYTKTRAGKIATTIGRGISSYTKTLALHLISAHEMEQSIEQDLEAELNSPSFNRYHAILNRFQVAPKCKAALLTRIYPFEDFLHEGKPIREYIHGQNSKRPNQRTKRDRSEGAFKLTLGMGKVLVQSGNNLEWRAGGSVYARTEIWKHIKLMVVILGKPRNLETRAATEAAIAALRQPGTPDWLNQNLITAIATIQGTTMEIASLRLHFYAQNTTGNQRTMATAGRFTRMLYKALVAEFATARA